MKVASSAADPSRELERIARTFQGELTRLSERQFEVLAGFRTYGDVPEADLRRSTERNVMRVVAALQGSATLPPSLQEDENESMRLRMQQGVPSDDIVRAHRATIAALREEFIALASTEGASVDAVLLGVRRIYDITDQIMSGVVAARHDAELALTLRQESSRAAFFAHLLTGGLTAEELTEVGPLYDIHPTASYWFVLTRSGDSTVAREIERLGRGEVHPSVLGFFRGDVAAMIGRELPSEPVFDRSTIVCVGPYRGVDMPAAATAAEELMTAAETFHVTGVVTPARLSLRLALMRQRDLGEIMIDRYITPLGDHAAAKNVATTVHTFLRNDRSVLATATDLFIHPNTVRYRLEKFTSVTGADFNSVEQLVELWWAFESMAITDASSESHT